MTKSSRHKVRGRIPLRGSRPDVLRPDYGSKPAPALTAEPSELETLRKENAALRHESGVLNNRINQIRAAMKVFGAALVPKPSKVPFGTMGKR